MKVDTETRAAVENMKSKKEDLSVVRPSIRSQVSVSGMKQAIFAAQNGTKEVRTSCGFSGKIGVTLNVKHFISETMFTG